MEKMIDLKDLLQHEVMDLYSAEEQIIEALPAMIKKARNANLKNALQQHLKITEEQKKRLDKVQQLMTDEKENDESGEGSDQKKGFFSRLFKRSDGKEKCKGMEGLIEEGQKIMKEDISPEALDAAIIASAQKLEHYEISGYGTARTYAEELRLSEVQKLLQQTLDEEYEADDRLTELALTRVNLEAVGVNTSRRKVEKNRKAGEQRGRRATPQKTQPKKDKTANKKKNSPKGKNENSRKTDSFAKATKTAPAKKKSTNGLGVR